MHKWLLSLSFLAIAGSAGVTFVDTLDGRLSQLEKVNGHESGYITRVTQQLASLHEELVESQSKLNNLEAERRRQEHLRNQVTCLEEELAQARALLASQSVELAGVGERQNALVRETLGDSLEDIHQNIEDRWNSVSQTLEATAQIAENNRHTFDDFVRDLPRVGHAERDTQAMWASLLGPTIQIADESTVGSGVLLKSEQLANGEWRTYVLTAYHVIRDVLDDPAQTRQAIPTFIYAADGSRKEASATMVAHDIGLDIALLVMASSEAYEYGALLPTRPDLCEHRVFDSIYAVGCPLGNDPIPTYGEIADTSHEVDGDSYWMISAPTYIGNSGGGVFDASSHELLGIFSKIYTHGNLRPTVVPHMGLVTPLSTIYDWLDDVGFGEIIPR